MELLLHNFTEIGTQKYTASENDSATVETSGH